MERILLSLFIFHKPHLKKFTPNKIKLNSQFLSLSLLHMNWYFTSSILLNGRKIDISYFILFLNWIWHRLSDNSRAINSASLETKWNQFSLHLTLPLHRILSKLLRFYPFMRYILISVTAVSLFAGLYQGQCMVVIAHCSIVRRTGHCECSKQDEWDEWLVVFDFYTSRQDFTFQSPKQSKLASVGNHTSASSCILL